MDRSDGQLAPLAQQNATLYRLGWLCVPKRGAFVACCCGPQGKKAAQSLCGARPGGGVLKKLHPHCVLGISAGANLPPG